MDYLAFTKSRTRFLRYFYSEAAKPFVETRQKIEAEEPPFDRPPWSENPEPPFLNEWLDAGDALDVLGQSVASLLSATLRLYVEQWIEELRQRAGDQQLVDRGFGLPNKSTRGWLPRYRKYCEKLGVHWSDSSVDLDLLEQLVLARNSAQHPSDITSVRARQTKEGAERYPHGAFVDSFELAANASLSGGSRFFWPPRLEISNDRLARAFDEVDKFCTWLDKRHPMRQALAPAT